MYVGREVEGRDSQCDYTVTNASLLAVLAGDDRIGKINGTLARFAIPPCPTVDPKKPRSLHSRDRPQGNPITLGNVRAYSRFPGETQPCCDPFWTAAIMICPKWDFQSNCPNCFKLQQFTSPVANRPLCAVCSVQLPAMSQRHAYIRRPSCHAATPWSFHCRRPSTTRHCGQGRAVSVLNVYQTSRGAGRPGRPGRDLFGTGVGSISSVYIGGVSSCSHYVTSSMSVK